MLFVSYGVPAINEQRWNWNEPIAIYDVRIPAIDVVLFCRLLMEIQ